jgi:hypothetical protein
MGTWHELDDYERYIRTQANPADTVNLLHPRSERVSANYPTILVSFDAMSEWMDLLDIINIDKNVTEFRRLRGIYQADKDKYRDSVLAIINQIAGQLSGRALLDEIKATGRSVVILPYHDEDDPVNATADAATRAGRQHGTGRGIPVSYKLSKRSIDPRDQGRGDGTDAVINFSPEMWPGAKKNEPGNNPDEVLYHEMVHASRYLRGVMDRKPINGGYDDKDEYIAVVITNIYMAEKGQTHFVANHGGVYKKHGVWKYDDPSDGSPGSSNITLDGLNADFFLRNVQRISITPRQLLESFRWSQPAFYHALARLPDGRPDLRYNWVKQYYNEAKGNFRM